MSTTSSSPVSSCSNSINDNAMAIRNYDQQIREQNRKKAMYRKQKEKRNYQTQYDANAKKRNPRNVKVIRATPISPNVHHTTRTVPSKRRTHRKLEKHGYGSESKENNAPMHNINLNTKKYEYGNPTVLLWMKKQRKLRAQQHKEGEKKKESQIKKRKDYILNLNKNQRSRARKVMQRKRAQTPKQNIKPSPKPQMIFDDDDDVEEESNHPSLPPQSPLKPLQVQEQPTTVDVATVNDSNDKALLLSIYNRIQQNKPKRKIKKKKKKSFNRQKNKNKTKTKPNTVEDRLNTLKDSSAKLQQRLENIAQTLHFPQRKTITNHTQNDNENVITLNPHFIEPIQCQDEIDKINCVFDKLQKEIECDSPRNNVLNIYVKEEEQPQQPPQQQQEEDDGNSITDKLLLELELLQNVEETASKLEEFEAENEKWFNFQKQKCELNTFLNQIKTEIEYIQNKKKENETMTQKQMELIKNTGTQITQLIKETQTIQNQDQKRNLELIQLSTNILTTHQNQNYKEKQDLQQTLKIAIELIDKYSQSQNTQNKSNDAEIQTISIDAATNDNQCEDTDKTMPQDAKTINMTDLQAVVDEPTHLTKEDEIESPFECDTETESESYDDKAQSELISSMLMSEIVTNLYKDTSKLFELRQNRASILCRQHEIERSLKESMGIFTDNNVLMKRDSAYVASYLDQVFEYNRGSDLNAFSTTELPLCGDQNTEQDTFNDLIFDTFNEVVVELKLQNKTKQTEKQIISKVQQEVNKMIVCGTEKQLQLHFVDDEVIDHRIRLISNEWIRDYENSYQWITSFNTFKNSMKFQIADMIFDEFIENIVNDINQIEIHRHTV
eukprot:1125813_1